MKPALLLPLLLHFVWNQQMHSAAAVQFKKGAPHVQLANGGVISGSVKLSRNGRPFVSFNGIPFATISDRFQESQPIVTPTWKGVLNATKVGAMCSQKMFGYFKDTFGEEDCLNLNVYVPMDVNGAPKKGYSVMVYVHGGAFTSGSGSLYGPNFFMDENVILVTINYRLGVFGFLSTGDGVVPGNNGLKDMVVALRWVQDNIKEFNGNKDSVTIFGESAGGASVSYLFLSPTTKGLFHRAISQSGVALNTWAYEPNPKRAAVELATYLKCPTDASDPIKISSEEILTCLKNVPADELNKAQFAFSDKSWPRDLRILYFVPTSEPSDPVSNLTPFMTVSPMWLVSTKDNNLTEIPYMVGLTEDEGTIFSGPIVANNEIVEDMHTNWEEIAPITFDYGRYLPKEDHSEISQKIRNFYFGEASISKDTRTSITNAYSDGNFLHGTYKTVINTASRGKRNPVYFYQYAYKGPITMMEKIAPFEKEEAEMVGHGDEVLHLFNLDDFFPDGLIKPDTPDEEFSKNLVKLWASFAIHGEPKHTWGTAPFRKWERVSKREAVGLDSARWFRIDRDPSSYELPYSLLERLKLWDTFWYESILPAVTPKQTPSHLEKAKEDESKVKAEL